MVGSACVCGTMRIIGIRRDSDPAYAAVGVSVAVIDFAVSWCCGTVKIVIDTNFLKALESAISKRGNTLGHKDLFDFRRSPPTSESSLSDDPEGRRELNRFELDATESIMGNLFYAFWNFSYATRNKRFAVDNSFQCRIHSIGIVKVN